MCVRDSHFERAPGIHDLDSSLRNARTIMGILRVTECGGDPEGVSSLLEPLYRLGHGHREVWGVDFPPASERYLLLGTGRPTWSDPPHYSYRIEFIFPSVS